MNSNRLDPERVKQVLLETRGLVTLAAKTLGCSRSTIYNMLNADESIRETLEEARQLQVDIAESRLFDAVERGESWAITFTLKSQGRDRGYGERVELTGAEGGAIQLKAALEQLETQSPQALSKAYEELRRGGKQQG